MKAAPIDPACDACENGGSRSVADFADSATKAAVLNHWLGSWIYRPRRLHQEAILLQTMSRMADLIDVPGPHVADQFADAEALMRDRVPLCEDFNCHVVREAGMNHRQRLISARLGLAVCRYRERHANLPDSLSDLTDSKAIGATGLVTGQPLNYVKTDEGFAIYDGAPEQGRFEVHFAP